MIVSAKTNALGFAPAHDVAVPYLERSREYYLAMGYPKPYEWAHQAEVAFTPLEKPLNRTSITVITTAAPITPGKGEQGAKEAGKLRVEGKDYIVKDGDVVHFRFNV